MTDQTSAIPKAPSNQFVTRDGYAIALKPWTADVIAANITNFMTFIGAWSALVTTDGGVNPEHLQAAMPGLRASLSNPDDLERVSGLSEIVDLVEAVWDYNEIGVGLGKALALGARMQGSIVGASGGAASLA